MASICAAFKAVPRNWVSASKSTRACRSSSVVRFSARCAGDRKGRFRPWSRWPRPTFTPQPCGHPGARQAPLRQGGFHRRTNKFKLTLKIFLNIVRSILEKSVLHALAFEAPQQ